MDREAVANQMKTLKRKAREARKQGKKDLSASFKSGMRRLQRRLSKSEPQASKKSKSEE